VWGGGVGVIATWRELLLQCKPASNSHDPDNIAGEFPTRTNGSYNFSLPPLTPSSAEISLAQPSHPLILKSELIPFNCTRLKDEWHKSAFICFYYATRTSRCSGKSLGLYSRRAWFEYRTETPVNCDWNLKRFSWVTPGKCRNSISIRPGRIPS
jgi:hypothetical protein